MLRRIGRQRRKWGFVPTGDRSKEKIIAAGLNLGSIESLLRVDVSYLKASGELLRHVVLARGSTGLKGRRRSLDAEINDA
jgi:ribose 5-phosphate isomerase A